MLVKRGDGSVGRSPGLHRLRAVTCGQIHHNAQCNRGEEKLEDRKIVVNHKIVSCQSFTNLLAKML